MCHTDHEQLCTLAGGLSGADGRRCAAIPGTYWPDNMERRNLTPGHTVVDADVIELPRDAPSWSP